MSPGHCTQCPRSVACLPVFPDPRQAKPPTPLYNGGLDAVSVPGPFPLSSLSEHALPDAQCLPLASIEYWPCGRHCARLWGYLTEQKRLEFCPPEADILLGKMDHIH